MLQKVDSKSEHITLIVQFIFDHFLRNYILRNATGFDRAPHTCAICFAKDSPFSGVLLLCLTVHRNALYLMALKLYCFDL